MTPLDTLLPLKSLEIHLMPIIRFRARRHLSAWMPFGMETLARGPLNSELRRPDRLFAEARLRGLEVALDIECLLRSLWLVPQVPHGQKLFVNVGVETMLSSSFESAILTHLPEAWRPRVVVEMTEGEIECYTRVRERVRWLRRMGIGVAVDDLGAQGSDLERLERVGVVDYVKIDRAVLMSDWARSPDTVRAWLREARRMSRYMGAELLVEGVEESSQPLLAELDALGVNLGQGYLFGQPVAAWRLMTRAGSGKLSSG